MVMPHHWDIPGGDDKFSYRRRKNGHESTAYGNTETGLATDKYSDVPILVSWDPELETYVQVDTWEWLYPGASHYDDTPVLKDPEKHQEESNA